MVHLVLFSIFVLSIILGRYLYKRWINQISIYSIIWFVMLSLYEFKLLYYNDLAPITWFVIAGAYFSFIIGSVTYFIARENFNSSRNLVISTGLDVEITEKKEKLIKTIIILTGAVGLFGAIQHWNVLLNSYGSFANILISSQEIYKLRVTGELKGVIPYLSAFSFVSVFFAGINYAYKNKFSFYLLIPIFAIILQELANISRAGMLFGIIEFIFVVLLFKYFYPHQEVKKNKKQILGIIFLFVLIVASATLVRSVKGSIEHFKNSSRALNKLNGNIIITPSIYLYFSADVGVLNKYLLDDNEKTMIGENTFMPFYRVLSKFGLVDKPKIYQKGYYIPMWVNTGTYLRELHADFGLFGVFFIPYLFGLFLSFLWSKLSTEFNFLYLVILVYLFIVLSFSFIVMISRLGNFLISFVLLVLLVPVLNKKKINV